MSDFETFTCTNCGDEFRAHPSSNAARNEYGSPACKTEAENLA